MLRGFDINRLRIDVKLGIRPLRITSHAQSEAFKDGLLLSDLRYAFEVGEVIEIYPEESRGLLSANLELDTIPIHIVIEDTPKEGVVITAYIPDRRRWGGNRHRRNN